MITHACLRRITVLYGNSEPSERACLRFSHMLSRLNLVAQKEDRLQNDHHFEVTRYSCWERERQLASFSNPGEICKVFVHVVSDLVVIQRKTILLHTLWILRVECPDLDAGDPSIQNRFSE